MDQNNIIYIEQYNEALKRADDFISFCENTPYQKQVEILLIFLVEYVQMWYKTKCAASDYWIKQYVDIANGYAEGTKKLRERIIELIKEHGD